MKLHLLVCGAIIVLAPVSFAFAKAVRLQTVNLNDRQMSTEGGEARLYRVKDAGRTFCRIEAIHYGETGKAIYVFDFGAKLFAAERREYRYDLPNYMDPGAKQTLTARTTLASREGRDSLPKDFAEYQSFFDARRLVRCAGN